MKIIQGTCWSIVPGVGVMQVDNINGVDLDLSGLPSNLYMVTWREGRGELETTTAPGLRTTFTDVTPYCPYFQRFMTLLNGQGSLTLAQAQKIQNDLVATLFDDKRQNPITFTPAGGTSASWSAHDTDVAAMACETIPYVIGSVGTVGGGTTSLVGQINAMIDQINSSIVSPGNQVIGEANTINGYMNGSLLPNLKANFMTLIGGGGTAGTAATPGIGAGAVTGASAAAGMGNISHIAGPGGGTPVTVPWSPIGATTPVTLAMSDMGTLMNNIAVRRQTLLNTRNTKIAAINALSTIAAVIAYSVTSGW